jgi:hypothetical protein
VNRGVEDPQGVIYRAGKKASHMVEGIPLYQARIDRNYCVIKHNLSEGRRLSLEFKRQI